MRLAMVTQWLRAAAADPPHRRSSLRFAAGIAVVQVGWVLRLLLPEGPGMAAFLVLVAAELAVPVWAERAARDQDQEGGVAGALGQEQAQHPAGLDGGDAGGEAQRAAPVGRVAGGRPQPLGDHGQAHDHVPGGHHGEVGAVHGVGHAGGQDQRPGDLHQGGEPVGDVVGVVGRGEPGEVHPRPPDGEEHRGVAEDAVADVAGGHQVVEPGPGLGDRDHEAQVEEQLQRGGAPVPLAGRPGHHRPVPGPARRRRGRGAASLVRSHRPMIRPGGQRLRLANTITLER